MSEARSSAVLSNDVAAERAGHTTNDRIGAILAEAAKRGVHVEWLVERKHLSIYATGTGKDVRRFVEIVF